MIFLIGSQSFMIFLIGCPFKILNLVLSPFMIFLIGFVGGKKSIAEKKKYILHPKLDCMGSFHD